MGKKRWLFLLFLWIVSSVAGCWFLHRYVANYTYHHPFLIGRDEDYVVVVDDNDEQTNILKLNEENRIVGKISYDRMEGGKHHLAWKLIQGDEGWYFVDFYNIIGETDDCFDLYYLDFQQREMLLLYENLETMVKEQAAQRGISAYIDRRADITTEGDVLYFYAIGTTENGDYWDLSFALKDGTCTLEQVTPISAPLLRNIKWGDIRISLYDGLRGIYSDGQQLSSDHYSDLLTSKEGFVYAVNQTDCVVERVLPGEKKLQINWESPLNRLWEYDLSLRGVGDLSMVDEENFAAAYYDLDMPRVLVEWDGQFHIYDSSQVVATPVFILWCVVLVLVLGALELGICFLARYLWNHGSVVVKILSAMIPTMALLSCGSIWLVSVLLTQYHQQQDQQTMEAIAQELHSYGVHQTIEDFHIIIEGLEQNDFTMLEDYYTMFYDLRTLSLQLYEEPAIWDADAEQEFSNQYHCTIEYYGLDRQDNAYYSIYGPYSMLPLDQWMAPRELEFFLDTIAADTDQMFTYYSETNQKFMGLILPSRLEDGTINGFYLILGDRIEGDNQVKQVIYRFAFWQIVFCALLVLLLAPVIYFSLKPLSSLRRMAKQLTLGELPQLTPPREGVRNEITDLEDTFRQLAEQFGDSIQQLGYLQDLSKAYFSKQILALFHKKSVAQLTLEEKETLPLYIAYLNIGERTFDEIQKMTKKLIGWMEPCDGFFASVTGEEIVLVSQKASLFYAAAAAAQEDPNVYIAFDHTPVTVQVLGVNEEYRFLVFPEDQNRKEALCAYRDGMRCRVLAVEGSFPLEQEKWSFRKVGLLDCQGLMECFLDSSANQYRIGQQDLERGVEQFFRGQYILARSSFIQALCRYPQDHAALYYIRLIDAQTGGLQKEEQV